MSALGCSEYKNIEMKHNCGLEGYADFAYKRCSHYLSKSATSDLSNSGQSFISNVKRCLIAKMNHKKIDCNNLWNESIQEHSSCFIESRYCELSLMDKLEIALITGVPDKRFDIFLKTSYSIGMLCLRN